MNKILDFIDRLMHLMLTLVLMLIPILLIGLALYPGTLVNAKTCEPLLQGSTARNDLMLRSLCLIGALGELALLRFVRWTFKKKMERLHAD